MVSLGLVLHSSRSDNLGVGALTVADVDLLLRVCRDRGLAVQIGILEGDSKRESYVRSDDVFVLPVRPIRRPLHFLKTVRRFDLIVDIGGGDSFSDIYGLQRIFKILFMKFLVHVSGRPLVLAPQTLGPFDNPVIKFFARLSLRRSALVAVRDTLSADFLSKLGFSGDVIEASDVALRLSSSSDLPASSSHKIRVGINVSGLLMNGGYTQDNMFGLSVDYPDLMREIISRFLSLPYFCEVHLIAHVISTGADNVEDDFSACSLLSNEFPDVKLAPRFSTPSEAKGYISCMDFFLGARMHSCIAAFSSGVPVVPMAYSRKFEGLFGSLGFNETVDCTTLATDEVVHLVFSAFDRRAELRKSQSEALGIGLAKLDLYETAVGDLIEHVATAN